MSALSPKVWFVGAGPGDPELITVKGRDLIGRAGAILYTGSLVAHSALQWAPKDCVCCDSKAMTQPQMVQWLIAQAQRQVTVVRLQTGDPSLYGALIELVQPLEHAGIAVEVVPGVSSAFAAAASAVETLTLPEITQTVIFTRLAGRTPVPPTEHLAALARHHCSVCLFLSVQFTDTLSQIFIAAGWAETAPVLMVHKASWPGEERIIRATLKTLHAQAQAAQLSGQTMIIISPTLNARHGPPPPSRLYAADFAHGFRPAPTTLHE